MSSYDRNSFGSYASLASYDPLAGSLIRATSSFVNLSRKQSWHPPVHVLNSIVAFFPEHVPLAFSCSNPAIRYYTERSSCSSARSYLDGFSVSSILDERCVPPCEEGGVVEEDGVPEGHDHNNNNNNNPSSYVYPMFSSARYTSASNHYYPFVGHICPRRLAAERARRGCPMLERADRKETSIGRPAAGDMEEGNAPPPTSASGGCFSSRCCGGCAADLQFCASMTCSSTRSLRMLLLASWWLSRYSSISIKLEGLANAEQLSLFRQIRQHIVIVELQLSRCVVSEEWIQVISACSDLVSLSLVDCSANTHTSLVGVDPILATPQQRVGPARPRWYLSGLLSMGPLPRLRCLHISHTPLVQNFLDVVSSCTNLECLILHRCRGVESLEPLVHLTALRSFTLHGSAIKSEGIQYLGKCKRLQQLFLVECRRINNLRFLSELKSSLRCLVVSHNWFSNEHMEQIAACTELVELHLSSLKRLASIRALATLSNLEVLNLSDNTLGAGRVLLPMGSMSLFRLNLSSSATLTSVDCFSDKQLQFLVSLDLSNSNIDSDGAKGLAICTLLRYLNLGNCTSIANVEFLSSLPSLRWLSLMNTAVGDEEANDIRYCTQLRYLHLKDCNKLRQLSFVKELYFLEYLYLDYMELADTALFDLVHCLRIKYLSLNSCSCIANLTPLQSLKSLRELNLSHTAVNDASLSQLAACQALEVLHLCSCRNVVDFRALYSILPLKELVADAFQENSNRPSSSSLVARRCSSSFQHWGEESSTTSIKSMDSGSVSFSSANASESQHNVDGSLATHQAPSASATATDVAIVSPPAKVTHLPELVCVSFRRSGMDDATLSELLSQCTLLTRLFITDCRMITRLTSLQHLRHLRVLHAAHSGVNNDGVESIGWFTSLEHLSLSRCASITDVTALGRLTNLKTLDLSRTMVTNTGIVGVARCVHLQKLNLSGCKSLTDINPLGSLRLLRELRLESTGVTNKGIEKLSYCASLERLYMAKCRSLTNVDLLRTALHLQVLDIYGTAVPSRVAGEPRQFACIVM